MVSYIWHEQTIVQILLELLFDIRKRKDGMHTQNGKMSTTGITSVFAKLTSTVPNKFIIPERNSTVLPDTCDWFKKATYCKKRYFTQNYGLVAKNGSYENNMN